MISRGRCLGVVWALFGRCLGFVWALFGRCLSVWRLGSNSKFWTVGEGTLEGGASCALGNDAARERLPKETASSLL